MVDACSISETRYSDMVVRNDFPRTSIVTVAAYLDRCIAA